VVNPLRLVIVTRRFWPLADDADGLLAELAVRLAREESRVTVLTARFKSDWPELIDFDQVTVRRLPYSSRGWGTLQYMRSVTRWLRAHHDQFDVAYVCGLRHDAYATLSAARSTPFPVAVRVDRAGLEGDCHWQLDATFGYRIKRRSMQADLLLAVGRPVEQELIAAGYPRERICYVPNGAEPITPRTLQRRAAAREALADAHSNLAVPSHWPLAVYIGGLHAEKGLDDLIEAWPAIVARWPNARLWLAGDGPHADRLAARIQSLGLHPWAALIGTFDDDEDLLAAADLFIQPSLEEGMPSALLRAMAASVPVIATAIPAHRALVEHERQGLLVPPRNSQTLAESISRLLEDPSLAARLASAARQRVADELPLSTTVEQHRTLLENLVSARIGAVRR
jgi:glycosyltransferase involved in cell wall biosynthesis